MVTPASTTLVTSKVSRTLSTSKVTRTAVTLTTVTPCETSMVEQDPEPIGSIEDCEVQMQQNDKGVVFPITENTSDVIVAFNLSDDDATDSVLHFSRLNK